MGKVRLSYVVYGVILLAALLGLWIALSERKVEGIENIPAQVIEVQKSVLLPFSLYQPLSVKREFTNIKTPVAVILKDVILSPYPNKEYVNSFNDVVNASNSTAVIIKTPAGNATWYIHRLPEEINEIEADFSIYAGKSGCAPLFSYPPAFLKVSVVRAGKYIIVDRNLPLGTPVVASDGAVIGISIGNSGSFSTLLPLYRIYQITFPKENQQK